MTEPPENEWWRVGYHLDPAGFTPIELCSWNHRFDDPRRRFRSIYAAEIEETAFREVLADLRPNTEAIARYVEKFGAEAADDLPSKPVTASWRQQNVLAKVRSFGTDTLVDLCNPDTLTSKLRSVTQAIAADMHDRLLAAAVQFPSGLDGHTCIAIWEDRGHLEVIGEPIALTDPPPAAMQTVCAGWGLEMEPADPPAS